MKRSEAAIATPCGADWKSMQPRGTARLCATCDRLVHDLSALTEREARALLRKPPAEGLCVRYLYDAVGNVWFGDDPAHGVIPRARLLRRRASTAAAVTALSLVPLLTEACGGANPYAGSNDAAPALQFAAPGVAAPDAESDAEGGPASMPVPDAATDADAEDAGDAVVVDAHAQAMD
jgi:hypothetical protein